MDHLRPAVLITGVYPCHCRTPLQATNPTLAHLLSIRKASFRYIDCNCTYNRQAPSPLHSLIPQELKNQRVSRRSRFLPVFKIPRISASQPEYWTRSCIPLATYMWNTAISPSLRELKVNQKFKQAVNRGDDLDIAFMKPFRS